MMLERPTPLPTTIEARASNRPIKIAYLVAHDESPESHFSLDGVFYEAYTRWGGAYTLVVPVSEQDFSETGYSKWLEYYDPDFIYSYVDIDQEFIQQIDRTCTPIAFLKHKRHNRSSDLEDWRAYIPDWGHYLQPVSSITTIPSPVTLQAIQPPFEREHETFVLTQYDKSESNRFFADNFGTAFNLYHVTNGIPGLFSTLCLTPPDLPPHIVTGTERCNSLCEALAALTDRKAVPIARYAMAHSDAITRAEPAKWAYAFRLFIGRTINDRIHFWNCRHFSPSENTVINSLVVDPAFFDDEALVQQLGQYLNRTNFLSHGSGQYHVELHSTNESHETLTSIRDKLAAHTWNAVNVSSTPQAPPIPSKEELERRSFNRLTDTTALKISEDTNKITAKEPAHFVYVPPRFNKITEGQWVIELNIERHNNLSKYSNIVDRWVLPKRKKITSAFTQQLAKPTRNGTLALLPTTEQHLLHRHGINTPYSYELYLPDDEIFFRHLALELFQYDDSDLRASIPRPAFADIAISDKGQNLQGVISMLDHLSIAYELFTNKYWRTVLKEAKEDATRPLTFKRCKLESFLPNDLASTQKLANDLRLSDPGAAKQYLRKNLTDTLEHLIRKNVFDQVANWRCRYCGHINSRSFDNMRLRNHCDICHTEFLASIDMEWKYELNDFVYRSLIKHSGLPVLWTLGFFQDRLYRDSYWYLPEVDLYKNDDNTKLKNEIDILCMLDGRFYVVEVKTSVSLFLNKSSEIEKYLEIMGMLRPDVAVLSFERYCKEGENVAEIKGKLQEEIQSIRNRLPLGTTLEIIVAEDINEFNEFPHNLGWFGQRSRELF